MLNSLFTKKLNSGSMNGLKKYFEFIILLDWEISLEKRLPKKDSVTFSCFLASSFVQPIFFPIILFFGFFDRYILLSLFWIK